MAEPDRKAVRTEDWVEVADEPDHQEMFSNEHIRVYIAVIRPDAKCQGIRRKSQGLGIAVPKSCSGTRTAIHH